jgi:PAS domain S-box-containing protein
MKRSPLTFRGNRRRDTRQANRQLESQVQELREELAAARSDRELDALRQAQLELEAAHHNYADLYDFAPVGYLSLDRNGCIRTVNVTGARLLGQRRVSLVGRPLLLFIASPDRRKFLGHLSQLRRGQLQVTIEVEVARRNQAAVPVQLISVRDDTGQTGPLRFRTAIVDRTERKRAEESLRQARDELEVRVRKRTAELMQANASLRAEIAAHERTEKALRESEARFQAIMDHSPALIFLKDTQGRYLHFNRKFEQVFQLPLAQNVGKTDAELFPPEQAAAFRASDLKVLAAGVPMQFDEVTRRDDGLHTSIVTKFPLYDLDGKIYAVGAAVTDITERKRLEAEVLRISQRERRRIAQDLHDGLGQQLAGLWCLSDVLRKNLEAQSSPEAPTAAKMTRWLKVTVAQARGLARGLHPVVDEPNGLMSALEELAANVTDLFKISCRFECPEPVTLEDNAAATHLYCIAQEAVTNAIKHGRALLIEIQLSSTPERITLRVGNNGLGFRPHRPRPRGLGLRIMNHRADMMGGDLGVQKRTGGGAEVVCTVPKVGQQTPPKHGQTIAETKRKQANFHRG